VPAGWLAFCAAKPGGDERRVTLNGQQYRVNVPHEYVLRKINGVYQLIDLRNSNKRPQEYIRVVTPLDFNEIRKFVGDIVAY